MKQQKSGMCQAMFVKEAKTLGQRKYRKKDRTGHHGCSTDDKNHVKQTFHGCKWGKW